MSQEHCKHCGACENCNRCSHCGHCKNCGKYVQPYPYYGPIWVVPQYPTTQPWWPTITVTGTTTWSSAQPIGNITLANATFTA